MSLQSLKEKIMRLPIDQQDHLAAFLVHLRRQRDAKGLQQISSRIDDNQPENWISLEGLKAKWRS